eukprot:9493024-Pyramimonas_sp.AAC.1
MGPVMDEATMKEAERKVVQALADLSQLQGYIAAKLHRSTDKLPTLPDLLRSSLQRQAKLYNPVVGGEVDKSEPPAGVLVAALSMSRKVHEIQEMIEDVHAVSVAHQCVTQ